MTSSRPNPSDSPAAPISGRGSPLNPTGRFESFEVVYDPDPHWHIEDQTPPKTTFYRDNTQSIVTTNDSPDICFSASINPYRGCEHGCIYCYARPTHEYLGMSGGLDFETKIFVKTEAAALLKKKLASRAWQPQPIVMSGITDPYQPVERKLEITRQCLAVLAAFKNPVSIITKNSLVTRDIDYLGALAEVNAAQVLVSLTSLNPELARVMEPRTAQPQFRLKAIEALSNAGIPVSVMMAPIIPGLTDHEIDPLLKAAAEAGARNAHYTIVRLPYGNKDLFEAWLETHFPQRKDKVLNRIRAMKGGQLNQSAFGKRMTGEGPFMAAIDQMFTLAKKRHGLTRRLPPLSSEAFCVPGSSEQLTLF